MAVLWRKRHGKNIQGVLFPLVTLDNSCTRAVVDERHDEHRDTQVPNAVPLSRSRGRSLRESARRSVPRGIAGTAEQPGRERPPSLARCLVPGPSRRVAHVPTACLVPSQIAPAFARETT